MNNYEIEQSVTETIELLTDRESFFQERINMAPEVDDLYLDYLKLALSTVNLVKYDLNDLLVGINNNSPLNNVIGVEEASELWNLSAGYIKNLCSDGKVKAKKIGKTWVIDKHQPHPSK